MADLQANHHANNHANGHANGQAKDERLHHAKRQDGKEATDINAWRLLDERGRQTWHYMDSPEKAEQWPQSLADRHHLGLPLDLPDLPKATTPQAAARNALAFFAHLQLEPGNWACEYGGPMFLLPGLVCTWYATQTPVPEPVAVEIQRYLFHRQSPDDGGWGLHVEGESSCYGTAMNYVVLRILGASEEDPRMVKARGMLHRLGGAVTGPHWAKFWFAVLGIADWSVVNPVPPELWLLPDWVPFAPWRWWIHMRMVFLPMSYIWSKKWVIPPTPLILQLRDELFTQPHDTIDFAAHRNSICPRDNYNPKSWVLNLLNLILVYIWVPLFRTRSIATRAEDWALRLIEYENQNTDFAGLAPVNGALNMLATYVSQGPDSPTLPKQRSRMHDYLWMSSEGMLVNGTNGVQTWDTSFLIQAALSANLTQDPAFQPTLRQALAFLDDQQVRDDCVDQEICYRHRRKGAWMFSTRDQGYTVSDTTSEALKAVNLLQAQPGYPQLVALERQRDAIDTILSMQNASGGFASYERIRGSRYLEYLNAAEVFGRIMIEYDYPECTTAALTALSLAATHDPSYRAAEIAAARRGAVAYVRDAQRPDGSWYGSWGICFTYAGMFALESLASVGETHANSARVRRACAFFLGKQRADGGWGESYKSCERAVWVEHRESQVVQTCWAVIALMEAAFPEREPVAKGIRLVMRRQLPQGGWAQEGIEGVFNKSCMISYPNYKFIFPIKALGMFAEKYGDVELG